MLVSPCHRVRLYEPATIGWEHPSVTMAAYDTPAGAVRWQARFDLAVPDEVISELLRAVAHDLSRSDRHDQQRVLRGPALADPAEILDNAPCPGAQTGWCGCTAAFSLDLDGGTWHPQWTLRGQDAAGRRWRAWFDQATPAHLIAAACHPLTPRTCAYAEKPAPAGNPRPAHHGHDRNPAAGTCRPVPRRTTALEGAPLDTLLAVAREVVLENGRIGERSIAAGVRARGIGIGTERAQKIAARLHAERAASLL
ncbi:DUF317 domain-containing protein [Kitasatospora sp. NPDC098663]|uniref:DUF317 domain-containing protein n=1 Tax=Kitasatospora sp. NPDC098663 TaxID=3364096 RepID=UPI003821B143